MTGFTPAGGTADFITETVASYPAPLRTAVRIAAVTRAFTRELMLVLLSDRIPDREAAGAVFDDLIELPLVERRPSDSYALHESARGPLLANFWHSDRQLVIDVAADAFSYFEERAASFDDNWIEFVDLVSFELICDPDSALADLDEVLEEPAVAHYPARRAALIGVVDELVEIGVLDPLVSRRSRMWTFEDQLARGQAERLLTTATDLGIDPRTSPISDSVDARIIGALGEALAHARQHDEALETLARVAAWEPGSNVSTAAHLSAGDVHGSVNDREQAEDEYFCALESLLDDLRLTVTVTRSRFGRLVDKVFPGRRRRQSQPRGTLRIRDPRRWTLLPMTLAGDEPTTDAMGNPLEEESYLVFIEGDRSATGQGMPLFEAEEGVVGAHHGLALPLAVVWGRLASLYATDAQRFADADAAARLCGTIAEVIGDVGLMSDAFDVLATIGPLTNDPDVLRFARRGNRDVLRRAVDEGDDATRMNAYLRLGWTELVEGNVHSATAAFAAGIDVARRLENQLALAGLLRGAAEAAAASGDWDTAKRRLEESITVYDALGASSSATAVMLRLGDVHLQASDFDAARVPLEEARTRFHDRSDVDGEADALESLARLSAARGSYDESSRYLDEARALAATAIDRQLAIDIELTAGAIFEERYRSAEAAAAYHKALDLASGPLHVAVRARCHENLGDAALRYGSVEEAVTEYGKAAEIYRLMGLTTHELRTLASQANAIALEDPHRALALARELVRRLPDQSDVFTRTSVRLAESTALYRMGREAEALELLADDAVTGSLDRMRVLSDRIGLLIETGQYRPALELVEQALAETPDNAHFRASKGWILMHTEPPQLGEAVELYRRAHELAPDDPAYQKDLATALLVSGDPLGAREVVDQLLDRFSDQPVDVGDPGLLAQLGFAAYLGRRFEEARKYLEAAAKRDPRDFSSPFDIALVELCRQSSDAVARYLHAIERLQSASTELRRGVLRVAIVDVEHALDWDMGADADTAATVLTKLRSAHTATATP